MLSPRYHLVSIVAIFLALALGLLAGSSFGQPALVGQLRERTEAQLRTIEELRGEVDLERARAEALASYARASVPFLVTGRLADVRVVVVTREGVPGDLERAVLDALEAAGARVLTTLSAQPSLAASDPAEAAELDAILGSSGPDVGDPYPVRVGARLAERLSATFAPLDRDDDVLASLVERGFLVSRDGGLDDATRLAARMPGLVVVVLELGETGATEPGGIGGFPGALVRGLADARVVVGAAEPLGSTGGWLEGLPGGGVVTVIGADQPSGAVALILGLSRALRTGEGGAFGGDRAPLPAYP